ncbi:MAG: response regulator [Anaerolineaceae bacterium]|nr:MAG: response regulator [Anaerolineaceae bacterium]
MRHQPPLILIADDQKPTATMLERIFEYEGYQVNCVYDGESAIKAAHKLLPDLIILDVNMPVVSGFDVLTHLREADQTAKIPTILITAMGDLTHMLHGLKIGADDYIRKPFHPKELLARAESKMKSRQLEEALHRKTRETEVLLRISEELSRHIEIEPLIEIILYVVLDLIPCERTFCLFLSEDHEIILQRCAAPDSQDELLPLDDHLLHSLVNHPRPMQWQAQTDIISPYANGMIIPILFQDKVRALLGVLGNASCEEDYLQLLTGISRQAALALQNAELHEIKRRYASDLEKQVDERTQELESTQRMLVRSEKLASIGRLASAIAHEINNPLLPIKLDLEGILEDIKADKPVDMQDIEHILGNVERIENTVENLLGFTGNKQVDSAKFGLVDLTHIMAGIIRLNSKLLQQENITVQTDFSSLPEIYGNRYQLEYVFMNLTLNARDAMPQGGTLAFKAWQADNRVIITVTDTGVGIEPQMIDTIFEPFTSTKADGNGLGLYISHDIMQKHNGTIEAESHVGQGTTFTLVFHTDDEKRLLEP